MSLVALTLNWYEVNGFSLSEEADMDEQRQPVGGRSRPSDEKQPGYGVGGGAVADRGRVDAPVALREFPQLHRVVAHRRQAVAAGLPGQQHLPGLDLPLRHRRAAGGLGPRCKDTADR